MVRPIIPHEQDLFTPAEASRYLSGEYGIQHVTSYLAKLRMRGTGPMFQKIANRRVRYTRAGLDAYATLIVSAPVKSNADYYAQLEKADPEAFERHVKGAKARGDKQKAYFAKRLRNRFKRSNGLDAR
jgi:hypothetical protein